MTASRAAPSIYSASSSASWTPGAIAVTGRAVDRLGASTGRLLLAVLGGLADVERGLIRARTAEGRGRAKTRGQQMGRPPELSPAQQKEATRRRAQASRGRAQLQCRHIHHSPCDTCRMKQRRRDASSVRFTSTAALGPVAGAVAGWLIALFTQPALN